MRPPRHSARSSLAIAAAKHSAATGHRAEVRVLVGTSLPFLLPTGLRHLEALTEALAGGAWGRFSARIGERLRRTGDLEHWAAFRRGFGEVAGIALEVARGQRDQRPDGHVPLRRRAPQLREPRGTRRSRLQHRPGGLLADPEPAVAALAVRDSSAVVRHRGCRWASSPGDPRRCPVCRFAGSGCEARGSTTPSPHWTPLTRCRFGGRQAWWTTTGTTGHGCAGSRTWPSDRAVALNAPPRRPGRQEARDTGRVACGQRLIVDRGPERAVGRLTKRRVPERLWTGMEKRSRIISERSGSPVRKVARRFHSSAPPALRRAPTGLRMRPFCRTRVNTPVLVLLPVARRHLDRAGGGGVGNPHLKLERGDASHHQHPHRRRPGSGREGRPLTVTSAGVTLRRAEARDRQQAVGLVIKKILSAVPCGVVTQARSLPRRQPRSSDTDQPNRRWSIGPVARLPPTWPTYTREVKCQQHRDHSAPNEKLQPPRVMKSV